MTAPLGRGTTAALALAFSVGAAAGLVTVDRMIPPPAPVGSAPASPLDPAPAASVRDVAPGGSGTDEGDLDLQRPGRALAAIAPLELRHGPLLDPVPEPAAGIPAGLTAARPGDARFRGAEGLALEAHHAAAALADKAVLEPPAPSTEPVTVRRGDTLMDLLLGAGIDRQQAYEAVVALETVYDPRRLRAGQALEITSLGDPDDRRLVGLSFDISFDHEVRVRRDRGGVFAGAKVERPQHRRLVHRANLIDDSLYLAAERIAVPQDVTVGLIKLFSWDVDFQRDLRRGDDFEILFEEVTLEDQEGTRRGGDVLYARLTLGGRDLDAYRFELSDGTIEYYDQTGRSLRKFLLRTPVDGARISSRFGMRRHPVLGYSKMHKGTDFAAPTGTPIYAAGSGRIERADRYGGYGNYVRIRHNGEYSTAYAHMSRFARGIQPGVRVSQGQVIGYVGTTGRSTGPHLHYEVFRSGSQINSLTLKHPPAAQLAGAELEAFRAEMARIDRLREDLDGGTRIASKNGDATSTIR